MLIKTGVMEIANRASLNTNTGSLDGLINRIGHHESSSNANAHQISNISGLQTELNNKAQLSHSHNVSDINSLQSMLDAKANKSSVTQLLTVITGIDFANQTVNFSNINIVDGIIVEIN